MLFPFVETPPFAHEYAHIGPQVPSSPKLADSVNLCTGSGKKTLTSLKMQPVVLLTPLSQREISSLCAPTLQSQTEQDESFNSLDSDTLWALDEDTSDSDFSISSYNTV